MIALFLFVWMLQHFRLDMAVLSLLHPDPNILMTFPRIYHVFIFFNKYLWLILAKKNAMHVEVSAFPWTNIFKPKHLPSCNTILHENDLNLWNLNCSPMPRRYLIALIYPGLLLQVNIYYTELTDMLLEPARMRISGFIFPDKYFRKLNQKQNSHTCSVNPRSYHAIYLTFFSELNVSEELLKSPFPLASERASGRPPCTT